MGLTTAKLLNSIPPVRLQALQGELDCSPVCGICYITDGCIMYSPYQGTEGTAGCHL